MRNYLLIGLALLAVGCSTQHTVGAGNPSLGVVSVTGPSDTTVPAVGRLSVEDVIVLTGAPFVGPTSPVLVMPSNANGVVTVQFTGNSQTNVSAQLGLTVGAYAFNFTTTNVSGSLGAGHTVTIIYDGLHFGENGSCTTWVASNVVFTQGNPTGYDTLAGSYEATCHNSQNAKDGDRGTFLLKRTGTKVTPPTELVCPAGQHATLDTTHGGQPYCTADAPPPPPPPPPPPVCVPPQVLQGGVCVTPPPPVCSGVILGGIEIRTGNTWGPATLPLDHNGFPQARVSVTLTPQGCAPATITGTSDVEWLTIDHNQDQPGYLLFNVVGNSSKTNTRTGHLTINGQTVTITQDHK